MRVELLEKAGIPYYEDVHIELITERDMWYYKPSLVAIGGPS